MQPSQGSHGDSPGVSVALPKIRTALCFRPIVEEFADPIRYISTLVPLAGHDGICKVVPPDACSASGNPLDKLLKMKYRCRIRKQTISTATPGTWRNGSTADIDHTTATIPEFEAESIEFSPAELRTHATLGAPTMKRMYWEKCEEGIKKVQYGTDMPGSAFSRNLPSDSLGFIGWNLETLPSLDGSFAQHLRTQWGKHVQGVSTPMLYLASL